MNRPIFHWDIAKTCNYRCSYCFNTEKNDLVYPDHRLFLDKLFDILPGSWEIMLGGVGEPFLVPNFLEIVKEIIKKKHVIYIVTNFSFPLEKILEFCRITEGSLIDFNASLHLEQADVKDFLRKAIVINKIIGKKFSVTSVARKGQVEELGKIAERFQELGIKFAIQIEKQVKADLKPVRYSPEELKIIKKFRGTWTDEKFFNCKGKLCRAGSRYFLLDEKGEGWRCYPAKKYKVEKSLGNLFQGTLKLKEKPVPCQYERCTCLIPILKGAVLPEIGEKDYWERIMQ